MDFAPGQRVEARCTRCRDIMGHVIVALVNGKVAKVECCACGSVHKYYPAETPAAAPKERPMRVKSGLERGEAVLAQARKPRLAETQKKSAAPVQRQTSRMQAELERQWQEAVARNPSTPVPYAMTAAFRLGSLVEHSSFGLGIVLALTPPDKMEVLFREGMKALRCLC